MTELDPYALAKHDAGRHLKRARHRLVDFAKTYMTAALLKTLVWAGFAAVALALHVPAVAFALATVGIGALVIHSVYLTKIVKAQDRAERWAYVREKRVEQRAIEAKIAMDTATLALLGERHAPREMREASPELKSALAHLQHRLRLAEQRAEVAEAVRDGTASDAQRRTLRQLQRRDRRAEAAIRGPATEPIKARRAALVAERAELDATIKSLATAGDIDKAMRAEEVAGARRTARERQEAARKADQAARERVRAGREPTQPEPDYVINLQVSPNGDQDVRQGRGAATPEQIARGENVA